MLFILSVKNAYFLNYWRKTEFSVKPKITTVLPDVTNRQQRHIP